MKKFIINRNCLLWTIVLIFGKVQLLLCQNTENLQSLVSVLQNKIQANPKNLTNVFQLAQLQWKLGGNEDALENLKKIQGEYNDSPKYHLARYQLALVMGNSASADTHFNNYFDKLPWVLKEGQALVRANFLLQEKNSKNSPIDLSSKTGKSIYFSYLMNSNLLSGLIVLDSSLKSGSALDFYGIKSDDYINSDSNFQSSRIYKQINKPFGAYYGPYTISKDKWKIYITRYDSIDKKMKIYFSYRNKKDTMAWKQFKEVKIVDSKVNALHPVLTVDEKHLIFTSDMEGGYGGYDLWIADIVSDGQLSNIRNMGEKVNTIGDECYPTIHDDILMYSSNGFIGLGGLDLYSGRLNEFYQPEYIFHMGNEVNSIEDDFSAFLNQESNTIFFSSGRQKLPQFSIYKVSLNRERLIVKIVDENNNAVSNVKMTIDGKEYLSDKDGNIEWTRDPYNTKTVELNHVDFKTTQADITPLVEKHIIKLPYNENMVKVRLALLSYPFQIPVTNTKYNIASRAKQIDLSTDSKGFSDAVVDSGKKLSIKIPTLNYVGENINFKTKNVNQLYVKKDNINDLKEYFGDIPKYNVSQLYEIINMKKSETSRQYSDMTEKSISSTTEKHYSAEDFKKEFKLNVSPNYRQYFDNENMKSLDTKGIINQPTIANKLFNLINGVRSRKNNALLIKNGKLDTASYIHATQMAYYEFFSGINEHNPIVQNVIDRYSYVQYYYSATGENLTYLIVNEKSVNNLDDITNKLYYSLINSPAYLNNIMDDKFLESAITVIKYPLDSKTFKFIAVQNFGTQIKHK